MRLIICDPALDSCSGHHRFFDQEICNEAKARSIDTVIYANRAFPEGELLDVPLRRVFSCTCYETVRTNPFSQQFDDFVRYNDIVFEDLMTLGSAAFSASDLVLFPTVTENILYGIVKWISSVPIDSSPTFVIYLMMPSGIVLNASAQPAHEIVDPIRAMLYRLAFREARQPGVNIHFLGSGITHAREYGLLLGQPIDWHPVLTAAIREAPTRSHVGGTQVLLFAGDAKENKGFNIVPEIYECVSAQCADAQFVVHTNARNPSPPIKRALDRLRQLSENNDSLQFRSGHLKDEDYITLIQDSHVIVMPYDPADYVGKSSGVLWETIAAGSHAVVPAGTTLATELANWGASGIAFEQFTAANIAEAVAAAIILSRQDGRKAREAAMRLLSKNNRRVLFDQLAERWILGLLRQDVSLASSRPISLALKELDGRGWYPSEELDGMPCRWSEKEAAVVVKLPVLCGWQVTFEGTRYFGSDQVTKANVFCNGIELRNVSAQVSEKKSWWKLSARFGPDVIQGSGRVEVVFRLPYAFAPKDDSRNLGLLVSSILLEPIADATAESGGMFAILHSDENVTVLNDRSFVLTGQIAGVLVGAPGIEGTLSCSVRSDVAAHTLNCFVNGIQLWKTIAPLAVRKVDVSWNIPAYVMDNPRATVLISEAGQYGVPIRIDDLCFRQTIDTKATIARLVPSDKIDKLLDSRRETYCVIENATAVEPATPRSAGNWASERYQSLIPRVHNLVQANTPPGSVVLVVGKCSDAMCNIGERIGWYFPQTDTGSYAGYHPANSADAIAHLEKLIAKGAEFLAFPETSFWWLDYYKEFREHLNRQYTIVCEQQDSCVVYRLRKHKKQA